MPGLLLLPEALAAVPVLPLTLRAQDPQGRSALVPIRLSAEGTTEGGVMREIKWANEYELWQLIPAFINASVCGDELRKRDEAELSGQALRNQNRSGKLQHHRLR